MVLFQVHQRQTERMRARSDWFLSDWPSGRGGGGVLGACTSSTSGLVTYRPLSRILSPRPTSLVSTPTHDNIVTEQPVVTAKPPAPSNDQSGHQVALRRKLSDKDKERRLVRRSSSKRKDKENGGSSDKNGGQVQTLAFFIIQIVPNSCTYFVYN